MSDNNTKIEIGSFVVRVGDTPVFNAGGEQQEPEAVGLNGIVISVGTGPWLSAGSFEGDSFFVLFPKMTTLGPFGPITGKVQLRVPAQDLQVVG
jgi:hypothetical protein